MTFDYSLSPISNELDERILWVNWVHQDTAFDEWKSVGRNEISVAQRYLAIKIGHGIVGVRVYCNGFRELISPWAENRKSISLLIHVVLDKKTEQQQHEYPSAQSTQLELNRR